MYAKSSFFLHLLAVCLATAPLAFPRSLPAAEPVDFERDVQPILAERCFHCHGQDEKHREGGVRLDVREAALAKLDSGSTPLVPGKPEASEIVARITSQEPEEVMPPAKLKQPLTPRQIETLTRWIAEGAPYATHWAFRAPTKSAIPAADSAATSANPIDASGGRATRREGLKRSPAAAPEVLCRRIHLDLIGLPPSPADVDQFVAAAAKDHSAAVAALVDRLLASPHFGEKWARHWLDAARYADSNGYEKDLPREQWAWRDWVINAFNQDLPYDQFLIRQIAGDIWLAQPEPCAIRFLIGSTCANVPQPTGKILSSPPVSCATAWSTKKGPSFPKSSAWKGCSTAWIASAKRCSASPCNAANATRTSSTRSRTPNTTGCSPSLNNAYEAQSWVYTPEQLDKIAEIHSGIAKIENRIREQASRLAQAPDCLGSRSKSSVSDAGNWQIIEPDDLHSSGGLNHPVTLPDKSILTLGHKTTFRRRLHDRRSAPGRRHRDPLGGPHARRPAIQRAGPKLPGNLGPHRVDRRSQTARPRQMGEAQAHQCDGRFLRAGASPGIGLGHQAKTRIISASAAPWPSWWTARTKPPGAPTVAPADAMPTRSPSPSSKSRSICPQERNSKSPCAPITAATTTGRKT